ncbi:SMI1/KNR4 family protein [Streptomyces bluensis]|uniref:SMI1/KNR4 family protein n=1 Tax=Streptomyces bluensis TaxID=33897 RepID=UPI00167AA027|nr:SMI1/KNR4 family protein [Streptomyces bluensis]GGZ51778.1 hypothetical protein GCM10010344_17230 [Streptomyces bluensis]
MTGRESLGSPVAWAEIERELDAELPADYKELCEGFGGGVFSDFLLLHCVDEGRMFDLVTQWRGFLSDAREYGVVDGEADPVFAPYRIYEPGKEGLIPWGSTVSGDGFYWLAGSSGGREWPIVARIADSEDWHRYDIGVPEFIARVLTDPEFRPFSIADDVSRHSFAAVAQT